MVSDGDFKDADNILYLAIPLNQSVVDIHRQVRNIVREHHPGKRGQSNVQFYMDNALYVPQHGKFTPLAKALAVYDLRQKHPTRPLWWIGNEAAKQGHSTTRLTPEEVAGGGQANSSAVDKKNTLKSDVSRTLVRADAYIWNVERGRFPVSSIEG